jgi:hypothetical protein
LDCRQSGGNHAGRGRRGASELDPDDARLLPDIFHARGRIEAHYESLLTELFSHLDPRPHDPWPRHASEPGASLAVTLQAYRAIGGLPCIAFGEDGALVAALERGGMRVRHDPVVRVVTSGRIVGRAQGGVADAIRIRCYFPDALCDPGDRGKNRMPAVLKPEMWPAWLGEDPATVPDLKAMLAPYPSDGMICWPVNPRVGNVKNNDPSLVEPINLP